MSVQYDKKLIFKTKNDIYIYGKNYKLILNYEKNASIACIFYCVPLIQVIIA